MCVTLCFVDNLWEKVLRNQPEKVDLAALLPPRAIDGKNTLAPTESQSFRRPRYADLSALSFGLQESFAKLKRPGFQYMYIDSSVLGRFF